MRLSARDTRIEVTALELAGEIAFLPTLVSIVSLALEPRIGPGSFTEAESLVSPALRRLCAVCLRLVIAAPGRRKPTGAENSKPAGRHARLSPAIHAYVRIEIIDNRNRPGHDAAYFETSGRTSPARSFT